MSKSKMKEIMHMFRRLAVKGATICLLGHSNKYPDKDGKLVYEGTADLRADVDELIYLYPDKDTDKKIQTITSDPDKSRLMFEPVAYQIDFNNNRKVTKLGSVEPAINKEENELIEHIKDAIRFGDDSQKEIIDYVRTVSTFGRDRIKNLLIDKSKAPDVLWAAVRTGTKNHLKYVINVDGNGG